MTKVQTQDYTNCIESSDMIIEYYKYRQTTGLEKYFLDIENWLNKDLSEDENLPLVIEAEEGVGKKTLLVKWMEYHQQNSKKNFKDLILSHFTGTGGNNSNYYYAIYKFLIKLREAYNISQKVELLEEKLKKYFYYWLDVCSRAIKTQVVNDSYIILIFESINLFRDFETGEEAQVSMWLPKLFPDRVRVIVTADPKSQAMESFRKYGCQTIPMLNEKPVINNVIQIHLTRPLWIDDEVYKERIISILNSHSSDPNLPSLFVKTYLSMLLPYPSDNIIKETDIDKAELKEYFMKLNFEALESVKSMKDLFNFLLNHFSKVIMPEEKFITAIGALTLTQKGLSANEIMLITKLTPQEWNYLIAIFKIFFMRYKGFWKINNEIFKDVLTEKYLHDPKYTRELHMKIADLLEKTPNSIRKLEEQTYHLFASKNYFKLKEAVSNIENFLLLFNPNNKYDLCRYWQVLEAKGFDPSTEYTKQIESFDMHYRPPPEDTFRIIIQISRFLKEFSDFETEFTPSFRHPPIKGGKELTEIGIRKEIKKMEMFIPEEIGENEEDVDEMEELEFELLGELKGSKLIDEAKDIVKEIHNNIKLKKTRQQQLQQQQQQQNASSSNTFITNLNTTNAGLNTTNMAMATTQKKLLTPIDRMIIHRKSNSHSKNRDPPILGHIESLNVDIPDNRYKVREYYLKNMEQKDEYYIKKEEKIPDKIGLVMKEDMGQSEGENSSDDDESQKNNPNFLTSIISNKAKPGNTGIQPITKLAQREDRPPTFYYYKRWLWMMFPWACLTHKANFSQIIFECFSSPTRYMAVDEERKYTQEALRITIEAKLKKKAMYAKTDDIGNKESGKKTDRRLKANNSNLNSTRSEAHMQNSNQISLINNSIAYNNIPGEATADLRPILPRKSLIILKNNNETSGSMAELNSPLESNPALSSSKPMENKQFFITSEFLNLNSLNNFNYTERIRDDQKLKNSYRDGSINTLNRSLIKSKSVKAGLTYDKAYDKMTKEPSYNDANIMVHKFQNNMQDQNDRELLIFELKVTRLKKELDGLIYNNKVLARRLKELAVNKYSLDTAIGSDGFNKAKSKAEFFNQQIDKVKKNLIDSHNEQNRLKKIIFVCQKNKKQNETWIRELNYLLQNLNKMIKWEKEDKAKKELEIVDLKKLLDSYLKAYNEKFKNHEALIHHLKSRIESKENISHKIDEVDNRIENSAIETIDRMNKIYKSPQNSKEKKNKMLQMERNAKATQEKLDQLTELYERAKVIIGDQNDTYQNTERFQKFLVNIAKKNDLERILFEKKESISELEETIKEKQKFLDTLKKASIGKELMNSNNNGVNNQDYDRTYFEQMLRKKATKNEHFSWTYQKNTQMVLDSQMMLQKITSLLGVEFFPELISQDGIPAEEIGDNFDKLVLKIKENVDEQTFQKFMNRELDLGTVFNKSHRLSEQNNFKI